MGHRSRGITVVSAGLLLLAGCGEVKIPSTPVTTPSTPVSTPSVPVAVQTVAVSGSVSLARAGEAVAGATVSVPGTSYSATTDANGRYSLLVPTATPVLLITKDGYASTRVENFSTDVPQVINEILQKVFRPDLPATPPTVTLDIADGATVSGDLNVNVKTVTASPEVNGPYAGTVSIGVDSGSSGFLNAGRTRSYLTLSGNDTFKFAASALSAFSGNVDLHVGIYDFNGNRTHVIRHLKFTAAANASAVVAPTSLKPTAITFADPATFGALGVTPGAATALKSWVASKDPADLQALRQQVARTGAAQAVVAQTGAAQTAQDVAPADLTPQAAPGGTVVWADVNFAYSGESLPRSFDLYRSLDGGQSYQKVVSVAPATARVSATNAALGYVMRDNSSLLTPGVAVTYKVQAVSDAGTADSATTSVTPLGRYTVALGAPAQSTTGVETQPIFRWSTSGASDVETLALVLQDRTQAEGSSTQWLSTVSGKSSAVYNFDGAARTPLLQPFHAYDWQLAAVTSNKAGTAYSVGADFFNLFSVTAFPVRTGPVAEFVTGGY